MHNFYSITSCLCNALNFLFVFTFCVDAFGKVNQTNIEVTLADDADGFLVAKQRIDTIYIYQYLWVFA